VVVVWTALGGCAQLDTYDTGTDAEYVGQIFGADQDGCADLARCSFIRRGFGGETVLRLRFNADDVQGIAGSLSTEGENCGPTLTDVPLVAIEPLLHDQLGLYEIPGGARVKNFIFSVSPVSGPLSGRDVVAFVSLVRSDRVEVRLLAGSGQNACDPTDCGQINAGGCDYFGVFSLRRAER
jgi:hypothetical protein